MSSVALQQYPSIDEVIYEEEEQPVEREPFVIDNQDSYKLLPFNSHLLTGCKNH